MARPIVVFVLVAVLLAGFHSPTATARTPAHRPTAEDPPALPPPQEPLPPDLRYLVPAAPLVSPSDTFLLASYDWETAGAPDAEGWIPVDRTAQLDAYSHVAAATELDGGTSGLLVPLEGDQSLWCGLAPSADPLYCGWASLPGYGNGWTQFFASETLACDSVRLGYKIRWDSEPGYDRTAVEYWDAVADEWVTLAVNGGAGFYDGSGTLVESLAFSGPSGETQVRFRFESDRAWSDEDGFWDTDGALLLDSVAVECYNGGVLSETLFEDFEDEPPGSRMTTDGAWNAETPVPFGDFAALYPGLHMVQNRSSQCDVVYKTVWAFIDDPSNANYGCAGFPNQGVVPYKNADGLYIDNEIWSPPIAFAGSGSRVLLEFKIYNDFPGNALVYPTWALRSFEGECAGPWLTYSIVYGYIPPGWQRTVYDVTSRVDPNADQVQISLGVVDQCEVWCGIFGTGECHSHAPLYASCRLLRVNEVGPSFSVRHIDLFQDTFASDGTTTGKARADMAQSITANASPTIRPGDSLRVQITGLGNNGPGGGPKAYVYVAVWPQGQAGKAGANLEAPETFTGRGLVNYKRYPLAGSFVHNGATWYFFRMDTVRTTGTHAPVANAWCFDLNDHVFTPLDTICYVIGADDGTGHATYFSRTLDGQGSDFETPSLSEALNSPLEFTILPAGGWRRGGNVLYVDDSDDRGGPVQLYFDTAFQLLQAGDLVDRFDVLGPASGVDNSLASRVANVFNQLIDCYEIIIWCSGNLSSATIGDGTGNPEKSDDFGLLYTFLEQHPNDPGVYISGDDVAAEWSTLAGASASAFRSIYMNHALVNDSHVDAGEPVSPMLVYAGCFLSPIPDTLIAYGGCPAINDFDVLGQWGLSEIAASYPNASGAATLRQVTPNAAASSARVVLSGFSYHYIADDRPRFPPDRVEHLRDILRYCLFGGPLGYPVGIDPIPARANYLRDAHPNPFNPTTRIEYGVREPGHVSLRVYDVAGRLVRTLVDEDVKTPREGGFVVEWDGRNDAGQSVSSGVYFYTLVAKNFTQTKKTVFLK